MVLNAHLDLAANAARSHLAARAVLHAELDANHGHNNCDAGAPDLHRRYDEVAALLDRQGQALRDDPEEARSVVEVRLDRTDVGWFCHLVRVRKGWDTIEGRTSAVRHQAA